MIWSLELVRVSFKRHGDQSLPLQDRLSALSMFDPALAEARERARVIADRLWPLGPSCHGFHDPAGFMERAYQRGQNKRVFKRAFERLLGVIIARDGLLPEIVSA